MSNNTIIYIAGPMTGLPNYNKEAFDAAAIRIAADNYVVINPASNFGGDQTLTHAQYMRYSIHQLLIVDAVYMLNNWQLSDGAIVEHEIAKSLGLDTYYE